MTHIQNRNWLLVIGHRLSVVGENQTPDTKNLRPLKSWLKLILLSYILIIALLFNLTPLVLAEQILTGEKPKRQTRRKITADSLKWEYEKGIAIFSGNVTMNGEEGEITSSKMTVFFDDKDQIEKIIGEGTVNLIREKQKGGGRLIEIYPSKNLLVLKNRAWIASDRVLFKGEEITFDTSEEIIHIAEGVRGEIQTGSTEKTLNGGTEAQSSKDTKEKENN